MTSRTRSLLFAIFIRNLEGPVYLAVSGYEEKPPGNFLSGGFSMKGRRPHCPYSESRLRKSENSGLAFLPTVALGLQQRGVVDFLSG